MLHFSASLSGSLMSVTAGTEHWFTAATAANGWIWADALAGPTIGAENSNAHRSVGGAGLCADGGPHCGPWTDLHTDLAFAITATPVPEPQSYALMLAGVGAVGLFRRRLRSNPCA